MMWIPLAIAVAVLLAVTAFVLRRRRFHPFVLGQLYADAQAREAARLAQGATGPSPLPAGDYDQDRGEYDLVSVTVLPLDRALQAAVEAYRRAAGSHAEIRSRIDMDGFYTLIHFAKRCAVHGLREPTASWCDDGLTALAMIDEARIDPRDAAWAAGLLSHTVGATVADRAALIDRVQRLASPGMAPILARAREPEPLSGWGYAEIRTADGVGLIQADSRPYEPTLDLTGLSLRLAAQLERGRYTADPEIATQLPGVWFGSGQRQAEALLTRARAGVAVRGTLRTGVVDEPSWQMLMVWVVELPAADDAAALVGWVRNELRRDARFTLGVASGRLFALFVAGSSAVGTASFETPKTLRALADEMKPLLDAAASGA